MLNWRRWPVGHHQVWQPYLIHCAFLNSEVFVGYSYNWLISACCQTFLILTQHIVWSMVTEILVRKIDQCYFLRHWLLPRLLATLFAVSKLLFVCPLHLMPVLNLTTLLYNKYAKQASGVRKTFTKSISEGLVSRLPMLFVTECNQHAVSCDKSHSWISIKLLKVASQELGGIIHDAVLFLVLWHLSVCYWISYSFSLTFIVVNQHDERESFPGFTTTLLLPASNLCFLWDRDTLKSSGCH